MSTTQHIDDIIDKKMRDDGFLPSELPEWKTETEPPARPPKRKMVCQLVDGVDVTIELPETRSKYSAHSATYAFAYLRDFAPNDADEEARKRLALPLLADKMEQALVVLRAMIRADKEKEKIR